ncbi:MAG: GNAT family N-acetyltransferase [Agriterribacter sp.]
MESIKKLNWDSNFFGYNIGSVNISKSDKFNLANLNTTIKHSNYDLIYLFCDVELDSFEVQKSIPDAILVDEKVTFTKSLLAEILPKKKENIFVIHQGTESLYEIALQIGVHSRFNVDKNIGKSNYEKLYKAWLDESVSRKICDEVFGWVNDGEIEGLMTIGQKKELMNIGLIGVNHQSRGKGIATSLLEHAELYTQTKGLKEIQIVTQKQNLPAINLYLKLGYSQESVTKIFHIWKQK